jgi:hypothetical protein
MKRILILGSIFLLSFISLLAVTEKIEIKGNDVELVFENITLKKFAFHDKKYIEVKYDKSDKIEIQKESGFLRISAPVQAKVSLKIPEKKSYHFTKDKNSKCSFDVNQLSFIGPQGEKIELKNGNLTILVEDGEQRVEINQDGIFVTSEDEKVEVSSQGIIVQSEGENTVLTGFWGRLLGKTIRSLTNIPFRIIAKDPATFAMHIVNSNDSNDFSFNLGSDSQFESDFQGIYEGKSDLTIHVENHKGSISIEPWDEDYVEVQATIRAEKEESDLEKVEIAIWGSKSGDVCHVETKELEKSIRVSVNYSIRVPQKAKVGSINTVSGNITIEDVGGNMELNTTNGNIDVENCMGIVSAKTTNGNINCEEIYSIEAIKTTNGNINIEISKIEEETNVSATNGNIYLTLAKKFDAEFDVSTKLGVINAKDVDFSKKSEDKKILKGVWGRGGNKISVSTSIGNITINQTNTKE